MASWKFLSHKSPFGEEAGEEMEIDVGSESFYELTKFVELAPSRVPPPSN